MQETRQEAAKEVMAGGRPSKYKTEFAAQASKLCALGATDAQLADFFNVTITTINNWKVTQQEFFNSLKLAKEESDKSVEKSLYQRARGYEHDEVDIRVINNEVVMTPIRKHYPPDTTACIFWLKNRKSAEWRDKQELEHSGGVSIIASPLDERI